MTEKMKTFKTRKHTESALRSIECRLELLDIEIHRMRDEYAYLVRLRDGCEWELENCAFEDDEKSA